MTDSLINEVIITEADYLIWKQEFAEATKEINRLKSVQRKLHTKMEFYLVLKGEAQWTR